MNEIKEKICCFTGHRQIAQQDIPKIKSILTNKIIELINKGYFIFESGGAVGFDTLASQCVIALKSKYPHIRLNLILPYLEQSKAWTNKEKLIYEDIKTKANKIVYTQEEYSKGCMFKRNRRLIDDSDTCIAYLHKNTGGAYYTVKYAEKMMTNVINIAK